MEKTYIIHNSNKMFVMYDPPNVLKNIHNNFMKSDYK